MNRRDFLTATTAWAGALKAAQSKTIGLGMGNYGMKAFPVDEAINFIADTGYDSVELTMMKGYNTEAAVASAATRKQVRTLLGDRGMALPSLLEQLPMFGDAASHKECLERIRRDAHFGSDANAGVGGIAPCVQTHIGGKPEDWDRFKNMVVDRLGDWGRVGAEMKTVVAIKGHNLNFNDTSDRTLWLIKQVNSSWLRVLYDYSHYQPVGEKLGDTLDKLLPYTAMISIKDGKNYTDKPGFERLLPTDGTVDYLDYYRRLIKSGYSGHTVVEISSQIHSRPGYDPTKTVRYCYERVAPIMAKAGVKRPAHRKA